MAEPTYTLAQLDQLILGAMRLGFIDKHWKAKREQLLAVHTEQEKRP